MKIIRTQDFEKSLRKLPEDIQKLYIRQEIRFQENWHDSRLHITKVRILKYALSFRITRRYRVFFYFQSEDTVIFFDVDHRKDAYK